jgi:hypothetical protein
VPTQDPPCLDSDAVQREVLSGDALTFAQVAAELPPSRKNKPVTPSCIWRWARRGVKRPGGRVVKLEVCRVGCRWLTSRAALTRFVRELNQQPHEFEAKPRQPSRTQDPVRAAEVEKAKAELRGLGI